MTQPNLQKRIYTKDFFQTFSIAHGKSKEVKEYLIQRLVALQLYALIKPKFEVTLKTGKRKEVKTLTPHLVSRSQFIDFEEITKFKI